MAAVTLGSKAVGSTVKIKVNGADWEFIVVHQGKPSSMYDDSCNGTWLLMKNCYENRQWHSSNVNDYANSTIHSYLNSTFLNLINATIRSQIKQVKIPYRVGNGYNKNVNISSDGLGCKIFFLSIFEVGCDKVQVPVDGTKLEYFDYGITDGAAKNKRIAYLGENPFAWWTRSTTIDEIDRVLRIGVDGTNGVSSPGSSQYTAIRPAFILPTNLMVNDGGNVVVNSAPTVPGSINVPGTVKGGSTCAVSWAGSTDPDGNLSGYILQRSVNGGGWGNVYQGAATSYTDSITKGWNTVAYRVCAYDSYSATSAYQTSPTRTVINNTAPGAPASITVPDGIRGGKTVSVSWGAASDVDNNLSGYRLERSVNSGTWSQIYQGTARSYTDSITWGWNTVAYRARAYDAEGAVSGYTTSPTRTIFNNNAPTVPASITTTGTVRGGKTLAVSWGAATDVDGNLAGYQLERSVDGGAYAQLYQGTALTYTDSITRGWGAITYRVRAYDAEGAYSGYRTGAALPVVNNLPPAISGSDGSLGEHNTTFSQAYTITDDDGDPVTVTEKLDNQTLRTYAATPGAQNTLTISADQFRRVLNGSHTLTVTAADDHGGSSARAWTFTKNITQYSVSFAAPLPADAMPTKCIIHVTGYIPPGAALSIKVCNNGNDAQPTWEDCTQQVMDGRKYFFTNKTKTAGAWGFNFLLEVDRAGAGETCFTSGIGGNFE